MPASVNAPALMTPALIAVAATKTATGNSGNGVDMSDYEGVVQFVLNSAKGTGNADNTLDVKLQESDTSGGTFTDISGATFTQVLGTGGSDVAYAVAVDMKPRKKFIRALWTIAGTTPSFVFGVTASGMKKYR